MIGGISEVLEKIFIFQFKTLGYSIGGYFMRNIFNKYIRVARLYPAIITIIPILTLTVYLSDTELSKYLIDMLSLKILGNLSLGLVLLYLLMQFNRFISKEFYEKRIFNDELKMPTTEFLLLSDDMFSDEYKSKIRDKIESDFNIKLLDKEQESQKNIKARKLIVNSVGLIRGKVKDGDLLIQHNIEFGFFRNLIGGSWLGAFFSFLNIILFHFALSNLSLLIISLVCFIFYLIIIIFSKHIMRGYGELYAKRLFIEYLS